MKRFLSLLFADLPDRYYLNVWTLPDKRSLWLRPGDDIPDLNDKDVYYGPGLSDQSRSSKVRLKKDQVAGITCLWADVDFGEGHKKNVPPDAKTTGKLLRDCGAHPSIVVHSGHGWHAYWLLRKPWLFETNGERESAAALLQQWQEHIRRRFQKDGYTLDATHDLTRVLRLPGTYNRKDPEHPLAVEIKWPQYIDNVTDDEIYRYGQDQFHQIIGKKTPKKIASNTNVKPVETETLVLDPKATPPQEKFNVLMVNDMVFVDTWAQRRGDLTDDSPSSYDIALAWIVLKCGWTQQETANLIIAWRRKWGHDLEKALRADYIKRTIAHVLGSQYFEGVPDAAPSEMPQAPNDPVVRDEYLQQIASKLRLPIKRLIIQGSENPQYFIELQDNKGEIHLGGAWQVLDPRQVKIRVYQTTGIVIPTFKANKEWDKFCQLFAQIAEYEPDEDDNQAELVREWVNRYLADKPSYTQEDWKANLKSNFPFVRNGELFLKSEEIKKYINIIVGEKYSRRDVTRNLRRLGFKSVKLTVRVEETVIHGAFWGINHNYFTNHCNTEKTSI